MDRWDRTLQTAEFLHELFDGLEGYVYAPTKEGEGEDAEWLQNFFKWPAQEEKLLGFIAENAETKDCYVAPAIFKAPSSKKNSFKETNFVWIEFDGNAPSILPSGIPDPTIKIQSSVAKHEHWYWRLQESSVNKNVVEGLTQKLAYTLDADKSDWDVNQVLRIPGTRHQESGRRVKVLRSTGQKHAIGDFRGLVTNIPAPVAAGVYKEIPDLKATVAKYTWPEEAIDLFYKESQPIGSRSSAMTALSFHCVEMGMSDAECYAVLFDADQRWGKYRSRSPEDRAKRLISIISHCRSKKELEANLVLTERDSFLKLADFRALDLRVDWLYQDFITTQGLGIISAAPGTGKSTLSLRLGFNLICGKPFLKWDFGNVPAQRVGFLSLEMASNELKKFIVDDMWPSLPSIEAALIDQNFFLLPLGYQMPLWTKESQKFVTEEIQRNGITFLIIDSLKAATNLDEKNMDKFFEWINKTLRSELGITVWLIHHNRKPQSDGNGSRAPKGLEDFYGDTFITAHPSTAVGLHRVSKATLKFYPFKVRLAEELDPFYIARDRTLDFKVVTGEVKEEENAATGTDSTTSTKF